MVSKLRRFKKPRVHHEAHWYYSSVSSPLDSDRPRAVMLLVVTDDHRLVLHHRDDIAGIAHPGCWAGFGGALEGDESLEQALLREMKEETGVEIEDPIFLTTEIDYEGDGSLISLFYVLASVDPNDIDLQEGAGVGVFGVRDLASLELSPFVRRAIESHLLPEVLSPARDGTAATAPGA